jgi:Phage tail protein
MGTGTIYRLNALTGWDDLPPLDTADVPRPAAPGYFPGSIYPQERAITADIIITTTAAGFPAALAALRAATVPALSESPLAMQWGGQMLQAGVRCTGRILSPDGYALGIAKASLRWTASDPRRYTTALSTASTAPPSTSGGVTWPVTWPVTWSTLGVSGAVPVANTGDFDTPPVIQIVGPLTTPAVYRMDTGDVLEFNTTLAASDIIVVDVLADTVTLNGAAAKSLLTDRSAPVSSFRMPPGTTGLALREAAGPDPTALMTVTWRSAYL